MEGWLAGWLVDRSVGWNYARTKLTQCSDFKDKGGELLTILTDALSGLWAIPK